MAFQFQCPQCANVLQAEEPQAGVQSQCPLCQTMFIIPAPIAPAPTSPLPGPADASPAPSDGPQTPFPGVVDTSPTAPGGPQAPFPGVGGTGGGAPAAFEMKEPELLHIPCPECKEALETPVEMLDQDVMCPHCDAQFRLRRRDSVEFKRKREQEQIIKEHKVGKAWFNWAIIVVVLVVIFLLFLIISAAGA